VWKRSVDGRVLHFYLAGINNQNFLMRDKETGTWWQQISGKALYGPMKGAALELVLSDELTFGEWKSEVSGGKVLAEVPKYVKEYDSGWEKEVAKLPVVISFPGTELKSRDVVVGLELDGPARAYPWDALLKQSPVMDRVHGIPLLVAVGPDGKSFRVFVSRVDGNDTEFFLKSETEEAVTAADGATTAAAKDTEAKKAEAPDPKSGASSDAKPSAAKPLVAAEAKPWILLDTTTASEWNFQGCAISGPALGKCLDRVPALKDYWFDWRNYHPDTTVYKR
jgi:ribosomal protein L12E/L44/L45/RPP1/RPP2